MAKQLLKDRIVEIRAEIDTFIDRIVDDQAKQTPGIPREVLRGLIASRAPNCECRQYQLLKTEE